ncbi:ATP-grasp domain-containing protein [Brevibacillus fulvus]|uniref:ATP-grasp domain-containing protein n=1 Tax=Brevibacillus fulvus TaxID=1125967 RepID=A0A938XZC2_9BACL|nr:ATP-grasp domain-containing protein [Brevibacillus fulvus]MBM7589664.1 hypothetical protein [Brevibacillus fulvus]
MNNFLSAARAAFLERKSARHFIWLANFEVEGDWKDPDILSLPGLANRNTYLVNNSLAEQALLLAEADDLVLLNKAPDPDYLYYLQQLGLPQPSIYIAGTAEPLLRLTSTYLHNEQAVADLKRLAAQQYLLLPHGTSQMEEKLSQRTGIPLATVKAHVASRINSKVYSRQVCEQLGIRQPFGAAIHSLTALQQQFRMIKAASAGSAFVLKDGLGVSGKGMLLIDSEQRFEQVLRMLQSIAAKKGHDRVQMVLEEWINKQKDIHYSFLLTKSGQIKLGCILEAFVSNGVHMGHLHPHKLTEPVVKQIEETILLLGRELAREGYFGIVGVDAMLAEDGTFYPCLEINARFNMSTYHSRIFSEWLSQESFVIARAYHFRKTHSIPFARLRTAMADLLFTREKGKGVFINGFSTVNLEETQKGISSSRLYAMLVGSSREECRELQASLLARLEQMEGVLIGRDI